MNYKEIIVSVNKRYVLFNPKDEEYKIYDKLQGAFLYINDPIINYTELVKELKRRSTKVYKSLNELPEPIEKPIDWTTTEELPNENIIIRKLFDQNKELAGVVVTYRSDEKIKNLKGKDLIEKRLIDYIYEKVFKSEGISTYIDRYRDKASVLAIKDVNNLSPEYGSIIL